MGFPTGLEMGQAFASNANLLNGGITTPTQFGGNPYDAQRPMFKASQDMQGAVNREQRELYMQQANLAVSEAQVDALQKAEQVSDFRETQALAYSGSGVLLTGSPLLVLEKTRLKGRVEMNAIINRGYATADMLRRQALVGDMQGRTNMAAQEMQFENAAGQFRIDRLTQEALAKVNLMQANAARLPAHFNQRNELINTTLNSFTRSGWLRFPAPIKRAPPKKAPLGPGPSALGANTGGSPFTNWNVP